jgi:hypothetical protein
MGKRGPQIKEDRKYDAMRNKAIGKNKAARVASAQAGSRSTSKKMASKGGRAAAYEHWSKDALQAKARKVGIGGRSRMSKGQLARALRDH